jgi:hypothetical protein|tara:strand:+ start:215 stop:526 length:312 start_codon:yes stop_codon:yes gene_type:complete
MLNFKFDKAFYKEAELLKVVPVPRSTFYSWQCEWISKGNDPELMGKILVKGTSTVFWNGAIFLKWLYENKFNMETKYDYQVEDKKKAVLVVSTLKKRKITNED